MLTPQDKIDEIYTILKKQERRERWRAIYAWTTRIIAVTIILLALMYPGFIIRHLTNFFYPIIEQNVKQIISEQKNNLLDSVENKIKNF